ncbi:hypothetical protein BJ508DRAFT_336811 [Ascobolus immersus RN42]|uniref:Uncharacterized protein n=1 Tax=Ascobolus immersus RN42 TaxID=1160509 RepID=A0A3N4HBG4_ASCIM|nr:hypothetical protein BJ508DRAFT_336811 [Ascobolus immersus RN42]
MATLRGGKKAEFGVVEGMTDECAERKQLAGFEAQSPHAKAGENEVLVALNPCRKAGEIDGLVAQNPRQKAGEIDALEAQNPRPRGGDKHRPQEPESSSKSPPKPHTGENDVVVAETLPFVKPRTLTQAPARLLVPVKRESWVTSPMKGVRKQERMPSECCHEDDDDEAGVEKVQVR